MKNVIAKFECLNIEMPPNMTDDSMGTWVTLRAVTTGVAGDLNDEFFKATPSGHIEMFIKNEKASEYFDLGKKYYVTFEEVTEPVAGASNKGQTPS